MVKPASRPAVVAMEKWLAATRSYRDLARSGSLGHPADPVRVRLLGRLASRAKTDYRNVAEADEATQLEADPDDT